ncbi:MAG TPA: hypothetical protein QGH10_14995 [Armatimonadota bacterium]|jgi:hypothetical protein|nr:hypothetical protein [Armatimonadota bacterium]
MQDDTCFKRCTSCGLVWADVQDFVTDPDLRVEGYQACFVDPHLGLILLTHDTAGCGTTVGIRASSLRPFYSGPEYSERPTGGDSCPSHCHNRNQLETCTAECDMAWARDVLQYLRRREVPPHVIPVES